MKKLIFVFTAITLVFCLCACSGVKSYDDCDPDQKAVLRAATGLALERPSFKGAKMNGDAAVILDDDGNEYVFIPILFTADEKEKSDVAMFRRGSFVDFASTEIPLGDVLNYENLSAARQREVWNFMKCLSVWDGYKDYGEKLVGHNVGTDGVSIKIVSVTVVKKREIEDLFQRWLSL